MDDEASSHVAASSSKSSARATTPPASSSTSAKREIELKALRAGALAYETEEVDVYTAHQQAKVSALRAMEDAGAFRFV